MMPGRRGILGGLGAAAAAVGIGGRGGALLPPQDMGYASRLAEQCIEPNGLDEDWIKKNGQFRRLLAPHRREMERVHRYLDMFGGVPPGVACMRASKPWFQGVMVQRWREQRFPKIGLIERALREQIFGEKVEDEF
jgi:hypothetical protein